MATNFDTTEEERILARIEKALRLADGNVNENEAATALKMAQQMADAYNIDIEGLRGKGSDTGKARKEDLFSGGLYPYQRSLYNAIAKLNHCLYWTRRGTAKGQKFQHRLVGSKINVLLSKQMGEYLQGVVERLARDYVDNDPKQYFTKATHLFREGVVDRIVEKIEAKRRVDVEEARAKRAEEAKRGGTGGNHLVLIDDVILREKEANYDFLHGEGAWAQAVAASAERAERQRKAQEAMAAWEAENPEAAALKKAAEAEELARWYKAEAKKAARRKAPAPRYEKATKYDHAAYHDGHRAGHSVSLDRQVDGGAKGGLLK